MKAKLHILLVTIVIALFAKGYRANEQECVVLCCDKESVVSDLGCLPWVAQINSDSMLSALFFQRNKTVEQNAPGCRWIPDCFRNNNGMFRSNCFNSRIAEIEGMCRSLLSDGCLYKFHNIRI